MTEILKEALYREKLLQYSVYYSTTSEEQQKIQEVKDRKRREKEKLDVELIKSRLGNLGRSASGNNFGFLSLNLKGSNIESIRGVEEYKMLQRVDVSHNKLSSLHSLSSMTHLLYLNASNNIINNLLDFHPPQALSYVDFSFNSIKVIPDLSLHTFLTTLILSNNQISSISGLNNNHNLKYLNLQHNQIQVINNLDNLNLIELNLSNNNIKQLSGISHLKSLRKLDLSSNSISKLKGLEDVVQIRQLMLTKNKIKNVREVDRIQQLQFLSVLDLCFNEIQNRKYYRLQIIYRLPQLNILDGNNISAVEQTKSENLYGQDLEDRKRIFKQLIPEEEFIDRRVHVAENIDLETNSDIQQVDFLDHYDPKGKILINTQQFKNDKTHFDSFNATETLKMWKNQQNKHNFTNNTSNHNHNTNSQHQYMTII